MPTLPIRTATLSVQLPIPLLASNRWAGVRSEPPEARARTHGRKENGWPPRNPRAAWAHGREGDGSSQIGDGGVSPAPRCGTRGLAGNRPDAIPRTHQRHAREAFYASLSRELRCSLDDEGRFLHVDGAWHPVLGWDARELRGWHLEEIVHPADRARVAKVLARLRATRRMRAPAGHAARRAVRRPPPGDAGPGSPAPGLSASSASATTGRRGDGHDTCAQGRRPRSSARNEELGARVDELEERYAGGRALRGHRGPPAGRAAGDRRELGDPRRRGARRRSRPAAARPARRDRPRRRARASADGHSARRRPDGRPTARAARRRRERRCSTTRWPRSPPQIDEYRANVVVGPMPRVRGEAGLLVGRSSRT